MITLLTYILYNPLSASKVHGNISRGFHRSTKKQATSQISPKLHDFPIVPEEEREGCKAKKYMHACHGVVIYGYHPHSKFATCLVRHAALCERSGQPIWVVQNGRILLPLNRELTEKVRGRDVPMAWVVKLPK